MKNKYTVALDISPLAENSGHRVRGIGHYVLCLKDALAVYKQDDFKFIFYEKKSLISEHVDLYHIPYFNPFFLELPIRDITKTIVTVHDLTPLKFPTLFPKGIRGNVKWQINKVLLSHTAGIVVPSQSAKNDVMELAHLSSSHVNVTPLGIDDMLRQHITMNEKKRIITKYNLPKQFALYVGDVTPNKNLPRILRALTAKKIPFVIAGKSAIEQNFDRSNAMNKDRIYIQEFVKKHKNVILAGFIPEDELPVLYSLASCVVLASLYEGFGFSALQAMAWGVPVVASNISSLAELGTNAALLIDPYNEEAITESVLSVMSNATIRRRLIAAGYSLSRQFTWQNTAEKTIAAYHNFLARGEELR